MNRETITKALIKLWNTTACGYYVRELEKDGLTKALSVHAMRAAAQVLSTKELQSAGFLKKLSEYVLTGRMYWQMAILQLNEERKHKLARKVIKAEGIMTGVQAALKYRRGEE